MGRRVNVIGVGMTKFQKPGASDEYNVMAVKAAKAALEDAKIDYEEVESAYVGYVYGDSTCGQRAVYELGLHRHPGLQRQQQLLDRLVRAHAREAGGRGRHRRVRARARLREDGEGRARARSSPTARTRSSGSPA